MILCFQMQQVILQTRRAIFKPAKNVACLMRELAKHKEYYNFSTIWLEGYTHPSGRVNQMETQQQLIRHYKGCDPEKLATLIAQNSVWQVLP